MTPLTVGIDYRPALSRMTGVGRYVSALVHALAQVDSDERYVLFSSSLRERLAPEPLPPRFKCVDFRIPVSALNWLWHRVERPSLDLLAGEAIDVAHSPYALRLPSRRGRSIVTIHDLYFLRHPEATSAEIRRDYVPLARRHAARADAVVAISQATADDVESELGVPRERIRVIPLGVDAGEFTPTAAGVEKKACPYALVVATQEPRKNLPRLVEAVSRLVARGWDGELWIAGGPGGDEDRVAQEIDGARLGQRVKRLGYVAPADLPDLYRGARLTVTASLGEGFGLPLLESMASGISVVASDLDVHREVAGDAAVYVDPVDVDDLAAGIEKLWSDQALANRLVALGHERVKLFSWAETAKKTVALYRALGARA